MDPNQMIDRELSLLLFSVKPNRALLFTNDRY